eukprot:jgi/Chlat1/8084/Chrsp75S09196
MAQGRRRRQEAQRLLLLPRPLLCLFLAIVLLSPTLLLAGTLHANPAGVPPHVTAAACGVVDSWQGEGEGEYSAVGEADGAQCTNGCSGSLSPVVYDADVVVDHKDEERQLNCGNGEGLHESGVEHDSVVHRLQGRARVCPRLPQITATDRDFNKDIPTWAASRAACRLDDDRGHCVAVPGEYLTPRYLFLRIMGTGTYGRVVECWDRRSHALVAVKIFAHRKESRSVARDELAILAYLRSYDPDNNSAAVELLDKFFHEGRVCLVFEKLGLSLDELLRVNGHRGFALGYVQDYARQILHAVAALHALGLVHTDLKPENIVLTSLHYSYFKTSAQEEASLSNMLSAFMHILRTHGHSSEDRRWMPHSTRVKLIDYGSATFDNEYHEPIVTTSHYRAPEVLLGLGWSYPCDMWSLGVLLYELLTGDVMFMMRGDTVAEHLAMMERVRGPFPPHMVLLSSPEVRTTFQRNGHDGTYNVLWPDVEAASESIEAVSKLDSLQAMLHKFSQDHHEDDNQHLALAALANLIVGLMTYEPSMRPTATQALKHPFLSITMTD